MAALCQATRGQANSPWSKEDLVDALLTSKERSGKTFSQIAAEIGCTNVYTASLFYHQQQLKSETSVRLQRAVPTLTPQLIEAMMQPPKRRFDPDLIQEPAIYRFYEAIMHNGEALKAIINEEAGDGIMSAIDMYAQMDTVTGKNGEKRLVVTLNGKFLPFVEGKVEDNVAQRPTGDKQSSKPQKPELMAAFADPEIMAAVDEIAKAPRQMNKYKDNKKVHAFYKAMAGFAGSQLEKQGNQPL